MSDDLKSRKAKVTVGAAAWWYGDAGGIDVVTQVKPGQCQCMARITKRQLKAWLLRSERQSAQGEA